LLGGATGLIGDPSGKDAERQLLSESQVRANAEAIGKIFEPLFEWEADNRETGAVVVNNLDWWDALGYIRVLRDIGKHFSVNAMIQRDSIRERLENRRHGISYTEFSYVLFQAYDFLHLRKEYGCTVQVAGSDQYGNMVSGMDLVRREYGAEEGQCYALTAPLVTKADGSKFGKTEQGAVWLTAERTSPYAFFQFWMNVSDEDVGRFLRVYTLLPREEIEGIEEDHRVAPHERIAQERLAEHMTAALHGEQELARVRAATSALFGKMALHELDAQLLRDVFADVPHSSHSRSLLSGEGLPLAELLPDTSLAASKREAREFLKNNAISVNGLRVEASYRLTAADLLHGTTVLLKRGKKLWHASLWD
jgi:tyrosyl-tRNA synthetase